MTTETTTTRGSITGTTSTRGSITGTKSRVAPASQRTRRPSSPQLPKKVAFAVVAIAAVALFVLPIVWILTTSLKPTGEIFAIPPSVLPASPTAEHFSEVVNLSLIHI